MLEKLREAEFNADHAAMRSREHEHAGRPFGSREAQQLAILSERNRTQYRDSDRTYSLRTSEIHTLTEVGKFRVVAVDDLANHAYAGDRIRLDGDLRNLVRQRLVERHDTSAFKKES